jgi:Ca-activated chloride channel family protein
MGNSSKWGTHYARAVCILFSVLTAFAGAWGQTSAQKVFLPVFAEHKGKPVGDLTPDSFTVLDNTVSVSSGVTLTRGADLPLMLGILIDTSNSQRNNGVYEGGVKAVREFVNQLIRSGNDRVFFERFSTAVDATGLLTRQQLFGLTLRLHIGGATSLYDAISMACTEKMSAPDNAVRGRRIIILLSDGDDNQSRTTRGEALALLLNSGVVVFAVSTNNSGRSSRGDAVLKSLSETSGGLAYMELGPHELTKVFTHIGEQIGSMYYLSYSPPESSATNRVHKVEIKPVKGSKLEVRAPGGYGLNP